MKAAPFLLVCLAVLMWFVPVARAAEASATRHEVASQPHTCPVCGFSPVARIAYGKPAMENGDVAGFIQKEIRAKRLKLAGCMLTGDDPQWYCYQCQTDFYQKGGKKGGK